MLLWLILVLLGGLLCLGAGADLMRRDRSFRRRSRLIDAEITGYIRTPEDRYRTQYRFSLDGREIFGLLPQSIPEPILTSGESIPLLVRTDDPSVVRPLTTRRDITVRVFLLSLGTLMLLTAVPLLLLVA